MRRYAEDTSVPVSRSRAEIDELLRDWKCDGIQWTDDFAQGRVTLCFVWTRGGQRYMARIGVAVPGQTDPKLRLEAGGSASRLEKLVSQRARSLHRVLLLWLKAAFNAVDAGLVAAEEIFLPFLVGQDGRTFGEVAIPRLPVLLEESATHLLLEGPAR